jgi:carbonic anhydrase
MGRRDFLALAAGSAIALKQLVASRPAQAADAAVTSLAPDDALAELKKGNELYVSHPELCASNLETSRREVAGGQAPWATIVGCADSRVPPELVFGGQGVGELFVAREAGNLIGVETLGTIEYGAAVLGSPLVVILAHTACGAVKAACDVVTKNATYPGVIGRMIQPIVPAALAVRDQPGDFTYNAARESARRTAAQLPGVSRLVGDLVGAGKVKVVAAIYDLKSGVVTFFD